MIYLVGKKRISNTIVILPNREVGGGGVRLGVAPLEPAAFTLFWSKNNKADVLDNQ